MRRTRVKIGLRLFLLVATSATVLFIGASNALACGGFFCQTDPVDQAGERIVFTVNDDGTITSLIEIRYEGSAADFSWILPIPEAIAADDLAVPDEGQEVFRELHRLTDVQIIAPPVPECAEIVMEALSAQAEDGGVEIFASGEVGPFGFDVIGSQDPNALIDWLVENNYRVDQAMEPLIDVYVQVEFAFVAMRLLDGETSESITPIEITYPGTQPMIPLRLTAVAALPDMPIFTWIFADEQAASPRNTPIWRSRRQRSPSVHSASTTTAASSPNELTPTMAERSSPSSRDLLLCSISSIRISWIEATGMSLVCSP